jgi:hypothetical protein
VQSAMQIVCLVFILFLGVFLRFATADGTVVDHPVRNDGRDYIAYAWNLKSFDVYSKDFTTVDQLDAAAPMPDAYRPPGYPLMLRALLRDHVDPDFWMRTVHVQAWIAVLTLICSLGLAIALFGTWVGLLVGLLVSISPHQSIYVPYFLTETLYGGLLMVAVAFSVISLKVTSRKWRGIFAGVAGVFSDHGTMVDTQCEQHTQNVRCWTDDDHGTTRYLSRLHVRRRSEYNWVSLSL